MQLTVANQKDQWHEISHKTIITIITYFYFAHFSWQFLANEELRKLRNWNSFHSIVFVIVLIHMAWLGYIANIL
jgi:hypothetical protein